MDVKKVYINEEKYPDMLKQIKEPPDPLYYCGNIDLLKDTCVAVVGSRKTTQYGRWTARTLGNKIAGAGGVVVSGMAAGIDTCAHWGAIDSADGAEKIRTIAVLGSGLDICYPKANEDLWKKIATEGLLLSEYSPGTVPTKYTFPRRNRIISGLSKATVVVQAPNTSGALITAEMAAEQGRMVYSVPGNINSEYNFGSNKLLRDGAMPLVVLDDLLTDLGLNAGFDISCDDMFGEMEKELLYQLMQYGEMTVDQLSVNLKMTIPEVSGLITILEMKGAVCMSLGKIFIAK